VNPDASTVGASRAGAALLLALVFTVAGVIAPSPAAAIADQRTIAPSSGSELAAPFEVVVRVESDPGEFIERVDARISGAGERFVQLSEDQALQPDGSRLWRAVVNPIDGLALPNGSYQIASQVTPALAEASTGPANDVRFVLPPPARGLAARPSADDATRVELAWESVALPDFVGYRVQRRSDGAGGTWATVVDIDDPRIEQAEDVVPQPGAYRYRLIVVRGDGSGGEVFGSSSPQGVRADPEDPGTFAAPPEPAPRPQGTEAPDPDQADPSDVEPTQTPTPPPGTGPRSGGPVTIQPPSSGTGQPPRAAPPAVVPFDDGVFEGVLPFDEQLAETAQSPGIVLGPGETPFLQDEVRGGGTLAVLTDAPPDPRVPTAAAAGLLLLVVAGHVRRFMALGTRAVR
jgi:hypothetical protein